MKKSWLSIIAAALLVVASSCSNDGAQNRNEIPDPRDMDPDPFVFTDNYDTCAAEDPYDAGAITCYVDGRNGNDIYAQRVDPNGTALWNPDGVAICTAEGYQQYPNIAEITKVSAFFMNNSV